MCCVSCVELDESIIERVAAVNVAAIWSEVSLEEREAVMVHDILLRVEVEGSMFIFGLRGQPGLGVEVRAKILRPHERPCEGRRRLNAKDRTESKGKDAKQGHRVEYISIRFFRQNENIRAPPLHHSELWTSLPNCVSTRVEYL